MSQERNKAPLALMEQIIMILVFALASAVCLQGFVYANNLSKTGAQKESAAAMVQTMTEYCKAEQGDLDTVCKSVGGERTSDGMILKNQEENLRAELVLGEKTEYLQYAHISVSGENDSREVYSADIAWQISPGVKKEK